MEDNMNVNLLGIDIGGTKCAVTYGIKKGDALTIVDKDMFPTTEVNETIAHICAATKAGCPMPTANRVPPISCPGRCRSCFRWTAVNRCC